MILEFSLYPLASLVWVWAMGQVATGTDARRSGPIEVLGRKSYQTKVHQDASNPADGQQNQAIGRIKGGLN